jgi:hypothetical protein
MPTPKPINLGPFSRGLNTAVDPEYLGTDGFVAFTNADIRNGRVQGFIGAGTALAGTVGTYRRFLHYDASGTWLSSGELNWAFDDAASATNGSRITYRTNVTGSGTSPATVIIGASSYRLGIDSPAPAPTLTNGPSTGGTRTYAITYYDPTTQVESNPVMVVGIATKNVGAAFTLPTFNPTTAQDPNRTGMYRRIYATQVGDDNGIKYRLAEITNNTTTTFTDGASYTLNTNIPLDWIYGGKQGDPVFPKDHRPGSQFTMLPNAIHSVNEGAGGQGSGIIFAAVSNWLEWSMLGYPHYWPAVNQMRFNENINCIHTMDAETYVFTDTEIYAISGVIDYALSIVKTGAAYGVKTSFAKTVTKTPFGLVFLGREGLTVFDGSTTRLVADNVIDPRTIQAEAATYDFATGCYYEGQYFLSFNTGYTYVFDLRDLANVTVTKTTVQASAYHITPIALSGNAPGLYIATDTGYICPWRPRAYDTEGGAPLGWTIKTGDITAGDLYRNKKFIRARLDASVGVTLRFYVDGVLRHSRVGPGLFWLPTVAQGQKLRIEALSTTSADYLAGIEVQCEVQNGA